MSKREGDVAAADLERHDIVDDAGEEGHRHEEDHDAAVRAEQLCEMVGRDEARRVDRTRLLHPHQHRLDQRASEHHKGEHDIHDPDLLVIKAGQPVRPERSPGAVNGEQGEQQDRAQDHDRGRAGTDDLADRRRLPSANEWKRGPGEAAEHGGPNAIGHRAGSCERLRMALKSPGGVGE